MGIEKIKFSSKQDWLNSRKRGIGASEASAIMGVSPYIKVNKLFKEKIADGDYQEGFVIPAMAEGAAKEEAILKRYAEQAGVKVSIEKDCFFVNDDYPFLFASLDGEQLDEDGALDKVIEAKLVRDEKYWSLDKPPVHFYWQVMQQIAVTRPASMTGILVMENPKIEDPNKNFKVFAIKFDQEAFDDYLAKATDFWENHVVPKVPYDLAMSDLDKETQALYREYIEVDKQRAHWEEMAEGLKAKLRERISLGQNVEHEGINILSKIRRVIATFDKKAFAKDHKELCAKYTEDKPSEVFSIKY